MNVESEIFLKIVMTQEDRGINKTVRLLMMVHDTLGKMRCEQTVKKFLIKEGLLK